MPPKKKPPSQAGKFKPLKRPAKKSEASAASAAVGEGKPASKGESRRASRSRGDGAKTGGRGGGGGRGGRSRSPKGRGGRGRGGGKGGKAAGGASRFVVPAGAAFFTGQSAKRGEEAAAAESTTIETAQPVPQEVPSSGADGLANLVSASKPASTSTKSRTSRASRSSAARAVDGDEGEEIVYDVMDLDEDDGDYNNVDANDDGGKKGKDKDASGGPSGSGRMEGTTSSIFDDDDESQNDEGDIAMDLDNNQHYHNAGVSDEFLYDSDSSAEERRAEGRRKKRQQGDADFSMPPTQLPFPVATHQQSMYDCQKDEQSALNDEKKMTESDAYAALTGATTCASHKLADPPLQSPFLDLSSVSDELKQLETNSWFLMKFPTRLPQLDVSSSSANASRRAAALIKSEMCEDGPETVGSSHFVEMGTAEGGGSLGMPAGASSSCPQGYDDTLKDAAAGRYGRIEVRKSGKTELVIGGGDDGSPEVSTVILQFMLPTSDVYLEPFSESLSSAMQNATIAKRSGCSSTRDCSAASVRRLCASIPMRVPLYRWGMWINRWS